MSTMSTGIRDPRGSTAWKRLRLECYERDKAKNARCVHCGQMINYSVKPSSIHDHAGHAITTLTNGFLSSGGGTSTFA